MIRCCFSVERPPIPTTPTHTTHTHHTHTPHTHSPHTHHPPTHTPHTHPTHTHTHTHYPHTTHTHTHTHSLQAEDYEFVILSLFRESTVLNHNKNPCDDDFIPDTKVRSSLLHSVCYLNEWYAYRTRCMLYSLLWPRRTILTTG